MSCPRSRAQTSPHVSGIFLEHGGRALFLASLTNHTSIGQARSQETPDGNFLGGSPLIPFLIATKLEAFLEVDRGPATQRGGPHAVRRILRTPRYVHRTNSIRANQILMVTETGEGQYSAGSTTPTESSTTRT